MQLELANQIGPEWYELGVRLGIDYHMLEELAASGVQQALPLRMLLRWYNRCADDETKQIQQKANLADALRHLRKDSLALLVSQIPSKKSFDL